MSIDSADIVEGLRNLSDSDLLRLENEVKSIFEERKNTIERRNNKNRARENERKKEREAELGNLAKNWCMQNLKPSMLVKVKGTRDGQGLREVTEVQGACLIGRKIRLQKRPKQDPQTGGVLRTSEGRKVFETIAVPSGDWTTNGLDKVRQVEVDGKWYKIKDLV